MALQKLTQTIVDFQALKVVLDDLSFVTIPNWTYFQLWFEFNSLAVDAIHAATELMEENFWTFLDIIDILLKGSSCKYIVLYLINDAYFHNWTYLQNLVKLLEIVNDDISVLV